MPSRKHPPRPGSGGISWICGTCFKKAYSSYSHAAWDADQQYRRYRKRRRERPYWSKPCGAFHVGSRPKRRNS